MRKLDLYRPGKRTSAGFTLMELMVTLAIAGVLAAVAMPNMRVFMQNNRLSGASNDLLGSFSSREVRRSNGRKTLSSARATTPQPMIPCAAMGEFNGWVVFEDKNNNWQADNDEVILQRHGLLDPAVLVRADNDGIESFASSGFANPTNPLAPKAPTRNVVGFAMSAASKRRPASPRAEPCSSLRPAGFASRGIPLDVSTAAGLAGACP